MGISYTAPKRAVVKKVVAKPVEEEVVAKPSAAFTMDAIMPDSVAGGGWGGDGALEIELPIEKPERKQPKASKRATFAAAVEIEDDIELDF